MKKLIFIVLLIQYFSGIAQLQYQTEKGIPYYADSVNGKDAYIASQCRLDIYYPKQTKNFATIVWFHGGGLTGGSAAIPEALMNKGYAVISAEYRLSPRVTVPKYIEDAAAAVAWAFQHISTYGGDSSLIFVSGHSAGAYLGMLVTLDKKYLGQYHIDANRIAALVPLSAQTITHFSIRNEKGIKATQPVIDHYAPLYHVRSDAPPIVLITGDREMELLGRYEENAYFLRMMKLCGHKQTALYELQGFNHGNMPEPAFPLLLREVADIVRAIQKRKQP